MPNKDITLYLDGSNPPPVVAVTEADTAWTFRFTVMYQNAIYAPNVANVVLAGHKPDGNAFAFLGSKSGNVFTVGCNVQMTAVPGDVLAALHLLGGGNTAIPFILRVQPGGGGTAPVASASALTAYATILNKIGNFPPNLAQYVTDWLAENVLEGAVVDNTFTIEGAAADAKETGDRLTAVETAVDEKLDINGTTELTETQKAAIRTSIGAETAGQGMSDDFKNALIACMAHVFFDDPNGKALYDALFNTMFEHSDFPGLPLLYRLPSMFTATGSQSMSTGIALLETDRDFTICCEFTNGPYVYNKLLFDCRQNDSASYGFGIYTRRNTCYGFTGPNSVQDDTEYSAAEGKTLRMVFRHRSTSARWTMDGTVDGVRKAQASMVTAKTVIPVTSTLLIGGSCTSATAFWQGVVQSFAVYDGCASDEAVTAWLEGDE